MGISWAAASDKGRRRSSNEDHHAARPDLGLFVVADGMGGHVAGEVALRLAVEEYRSVCRGTVEVRTDDTWPLPFDPSVSCDGNRLNGAFRIANRKIADEMAASESLRGMATTASAVLISGGRAAVAHVGDSRVYLLRDNELCRLTRGTIPGWRNRSGRVRSLPRRHGIIPGATW